MSPISKYIECEQCDCEIERNQGYEVLFYDNTYFCSDECLQEHIMENEWQNVLEVEI